MFPFLSTPFPISYVSQPIKILLDNQSSLFPPPSFPAAFYPYLFYPLKVSLSYVKIPHISFLDNIFIILNPTAYSLNQQS